MSQSDSLMPSTDRLDRPLAAAAPSGTPVSGSTRPLHGAAKGTRGIVARVQHEGSADSIADRLEALGFVPGEAVSVVATGPFGGEPIVVLVGSARFALRHAEAARVLLQGGSPESSHG